MTLSIVEFIAERLDEDEEAAKLVRQPYRLYIDGEGIISEPLIIESPWDDRQGEYEQWSDGEDRLPNRHTYWTLLYDPARALREIAAKRQIVSLHPSVDGYCEGCGIEQQHPEGCLNLRHLAAVYSDHPNYRDEWRPH